MPPKKNILGPLSPEIPSPVKLIKTNIMNDDDIENKEPNDFSTTDINSIKILLANGQPLLTNFEEKYLIDIILKSLNKDLEKILEEKILLILKMNYGDEFISVFKLNLQWIYDFILKHFKDLTEHINSKELLENFLKKNLDKKPNSIIQFKHWQLQTLVNEHFKNVEQQSQQQTNSKKRRMTVRHIDFK